MRYRPEPPYQHGQRERCAILLANLGTPEAPRPAEVKRYLRQFLSDPRVVEIPALVWRVLLEAVILPLRSRRSADKYALIWQTEGSPLKVYTARMAKLLAGHLGSRGLDVLVEYGMRYGEPSLDSALSRLCAAGATRILVLPLYPQYSATTTASAWDAVADWSRTVRNLPELRLVKHYHAHPAYIAALRAQVMRFWEREGQLSWPAGTAPAAAGPAARLVMSFHGLPRRNLGLGDPYHCECQVTGRLVADSLGIPAALAPVTFQSRFGRAEWLKPYTAETLTDLARAGVEEVDVLCPGFPADCLETLEEIALEGKKTFLAAGGKRFRFIPGLNDSVEWIEALGRIAVEHMGGWPTARPRPEEEAARAAQRVRAEAMGAPAAAAKKAAVPGA